MIILQKNEILRCQQSVERLLVIVDCFDEAGELTCPGEDVGNFNQPLFVNENVLRLDVTDFSAVLLDILLGSGQGEQQKPKLRLLEELSLGLSLLDEF